MQIHFPSILSRTKAMLMLGISRHTLEKAVNSGGIRFFVTSGGHKRYFKSDLIKYFNEKLQEQQG